MVDKLIKRKEAAEMLGISLDTLDHARMEGLIDQKRSDGGKTQCGMKKRCARACSRS